MQLAQYLHATYLSPTIKTFVAAINEDHFLTWPGLTSDLILRNLPKSMRACQGHMKSENQGLQSTRIFTKREEQEEQQDHFPTPHAPNTKSNQVCYAIIQPENTSTACIDLKGRFLKKSSRGNGYILISYHYDGYYIHVIPLKDRKGHSTADTWQKLHNVFKKAGSPPEMFFLDNETSSDLVKAFDNEHVTYQLVTPYKHRKNQAERAMQTCKSHFKSCLAGADPDYALSEWDRLIHQI